MTKKYQEQFRTFSIPFREGDCLSIITFNYKEETNCGFYYGKYKEMRFGAEVYPDRFHFSASTEDYETDIAIRLPKPLSLKAVKIVLVKCIKQWKDGESRLKEAE